MQIALGVFLGSDYHDGVKGVGVQKATRLVAQLGEAQVLKTILRNGVQAVLNEGRPKNPKTKAGRATEGAEPPGAISLSVSAVFNGQFATFLAGNLAQIPVESKDCLGHHKRRKQKWTGKLCARILKGSHRCAGDSITA